MIGESTRAKSNKPRMYSISIRYSQYVEAALRRIVSLSQDDRDPPDTDMLSSVPKCSRCWLPASGCVCRLKAPLNQVTFDHAPHLRRQVRDDPSHSAKEIHPDLLSIGVLSGQVCEQATDYFAKSKSPRLAKKPERIGMP
jgi:hypothetical protein